MLYLKVYYTATPCKNKEPKAIAWKSSLSKFIKLTQKIIPFNFTKFCTQNKASIDFSPLKEKDAWEHERTHTHTLMLKDDVTLTKG